MKKLLDQKKYSPNCLTMFEFVNSVWSTMEAFDSIDREFGVKMYVKDMNRTEYALYCIENMDQFYSQSDIKYVQKMETRIFYNIAQLAHEEEQPKVTFIYPDGEIYVIPMRSHRGMTTQTKTKKIKTKKIKYRQRTL